MQSSAVTHSGHVAVFGSRAEQSHLGLSSEDVDFFVTAASGDVCSAKGLNGALQSTHI